MSGLSLSLPAWSSFDPSRNLCNLDTASVPVAFRLHNREP